MLSKFNKTEGETEKSPRGRSRTEGENTMSEKEEDGLDKAEDRIGKLEDQLIEHNQLEAKEKVMKNREKPVGDKWDMVER